ncbi:ABC transporter permease [Glaesserella sp.]|uniref:ABC transporter permease n=1 Tax=Glaesserella sp. TaxID=2094731 RepID=UPI0035A09077
MISKFIGKLNRFYAFDELLKQLIVRDIKLKYRRSYLGYLWSILNPLVMMMVLVTVFSNLFGRFDIPNYPLYIISGQIMFGLMTEATNMSVGSIIGNANLIKKTYVPKYIFTVSKVGSSLVNTLFSLGALLIVMVITQADFSWNLLLVPFVLLQVFIFSLGLGMFLSAAAVFFRDIQYLWGVFVSMWLYLTPIFYPVNIIPEEYQSLYKGLNPMYWYLEQFRDIVLYARLPDISSTLMGFGLAFLVLFIGSWYFNKKQDEFILYI